MWEKTTQALEEDGAVVLHVIEAGNDLAGMRLFWKVGMKR